MIKIMIVLSVTNKVNQFYVRTDFISPKTAAVATMGSISAAFSKQQVIISVSCVSKLMV